MKKPTNMRERALIEKYNVQVPRYTSYPTVPQWNINDFNTNDYHQEFLNHQANNSKGLAIYIHLPFCSSLCTFCGCHKHITKRHDRDEAYINAVVRELQIRTEGLNKKPMVTELHLGGGTPTFFSAEDLKKLIDGLSRWVVFSDDCEMSFEGHPNNTSRKHLETLSKLGFNRVSFGIQDYNEKVQRAIHRIQPFERVKEAHENALACGFESVSHDLVYGLPFQTESNMSVNLERTLELMPQRISLYSYAHVPWVKGVGQRAYDEGDLPTAEEKQRLYQLAFETLKKAGYEEVGMDHFALPGDALLESKLDGTLGRNFMGYTPNPAEQLMGLGMSAISSGPQGFAQNVKTVDGYLELIGSGDLAIAKGHLNTKREYETSKVITQLICNYEVELTSRMMNHPLFGYTQQKLDVYESEGLIAWHNRRVTVTEKGKPFIRVICSAFDDYYQDTNQRTYSKAI